MSDSVLEDWDQDDDLIVIRDTSVAYELLEEVAQRAISPTALKRLRDEIEADWQPQGYDDAVRETLIDEAVAIRMAVRVNHYLAFRSGERLCARRSVLPHGEWEQWVRQACACDPRTARNYMAAFQAFRRPERVAHLPLRLVYRAAQATVDQVDRPRFLRAFARAKSTQEATRILESARHQVAREAPRRRISPHRLNQHLSRIHDAIAQGLLAGDAADAARRHLEALELLLHRSSAVQSGTTHAAASTTNKSNSNSALEGGGVVT